MLPLQVIHPHRETLMNNESNYDLLIRKIDEFIRKYYKNQLVRGSLLTLAALGGFFLTLNILEYFSWFNPPTRTVFFYSFVGIAAIILTVYVIIPLLKFSKLGNVISHEQAAKIIGIHFGEVQDALLNTLQLRQMSGDESLSRELIEAGINQKIVRLNPIRFADAVDLKHNRKYLRYALPPLLVIIAVLLISPAFITEPSNRILHYGKVFEKPAPFTIEILNKELKAVQQEDFTLQIKLSGEQIPAGLYIQTGGSKYAMSRQNSILFNYTFRNLQKNARFVITSDPYNSREYVINVLPKPIILSFSIDADYPDYTGRKPETFENTGDLTVPAGTRLNWKFYTRDTKSLIFRFNEQTHVLKASGSNSVGFGSRLLTVTQYSVLAENEFITDAQDSLSYRILVIPDLYPSISAEEYKDSIFDNRLYFKGTIKDDYGFTKLAFRFRLKSRQADDFGEEQTLEIPIERAGLQQQFYYFKDLSTLSLTPGDEISYWFEVWDNDGVNGSKSSRSPSRNFRVPTLDEIQAMAEKQSDDIKNKMEQSIRQTKQLQRQIEDMQKKMVEKKDIGWQEKQQLQQMMDKQNMLQKQVENIKQENELKNMRENRYREPDPVLLEKQQKLEQLFNDILPEEIKKMYEELQKLVDQIDKNKVNQVLEKMKTDNKDLEKMLDRNLELFKQLEFEKKMQETIDKMDKLSEEQDKLAGETDKASKEQSDELKKKQDDLNSQFDKLKEDIKELERKNAELEDPNQLQSTEKDQRDIDNDMQNSSQELNQKQTKSASKSQKNASQKMKELSQKLQEMMDQSDEEQDSEDEESMRQILDNLLKISFRQEEIMGSLNKINPMNPRYLKIIESQKNLKDDIKVVEDSLYAVAKRQAAIKPFVFREIKTIDQNMNDAMESLVARVPEVAKSKQQFVMTSVNNLALMIAESMQDMKQNMQSKGKGKAKATAKMQGGKGSQKMKSMRELQEKLNQQLQQMKDGMGKPNPQGKQGQQKMSEQLARMAAEQEALRKQLQQFGEEMQNQGTGMDKTIKEMMQQMEQTETDIVNKKISRETLLRQQEIVTRMLESEKAQLQRELDEKRESHEGKDIFMNNPKRFFEYKKLKGEETEMIQTIPPGFKPFYKKKAGEYFISFQ